MLELTPEEARELVERHGGQRAAARALGIPQSSLWGKLNPEKRRANDRAYYLSHREIAIARNREKYHGETSLERIERQLKNRRIKALRQMEKRNEQRKELI